MYEISEVREVFETNDFKAVNERLEAGWQVRDIVRNGSKFIYQLVRV